MIKQSLWCSGLLLFAAMVASVVVAETGYQTPTTWSSPPVYAMESVPSSVSAGADALTEGKNSPLVRRLPAVVPDGQQVALVQLEKQFTPPPMEPLPDTGPPATQLVRPAEVLPAPARVSPPIRGAPPNRAAPPSPPNRLAPPNRARPLSRRPPESPPQLTDEASPTTEKRTEGGILGEPCAPCCDMCAEGNCYGGLCGCKCCRFWIRGDVLVWWLHGYKVPELVTTSPPGTPLPDAGVLGLPTTGTAFGNERLNDDSRLGGRVRAGWWLDDCRCWGLEGEFSWMDDDGDDYFAASNPDAILARPYFDIDPAVNDHAADIVALDGQSGGSVGFNSASQVYSGAVLLRRSLYCGATCCHCGPVMRRIDGQVGYRYFQLHEELNALETPVFFIAPPGTAVERRDVLRTKNDFHGAEFGIHWMRQSGRWMCELAPRVALGHLRRRWSLDGSTRTVSPGISDQTVAGGFLVPAERIGSFADDKFGFVPQAELTLGYFLFPNLRLNIGYNFMFLNNTVRPDDLIDLNLDGRTIGVAPPPGLTANPIVPSDNNVWLYSLNYGLTWNF